MNGLTDWSDFDTMSGPVSSSTSTGTLEGPPARSSGEPFWSPQHPLFGFGAVVGITAAALYVAIEGADVGARLRGRLGAAHGSVGADAGVSGGS